VAHAGGRPHVFTSVQFIEDKVAEYKKYLAVNDRPATMAGLAYYLGVDRKTIYNYSKDDEFFPTIKKYRDWILFEIEEQCATKGHAGSIFLAKNYGYTDRQELDLSSKDFGSSLDKFVDKLGDKHE